MMAPGREIEAKYLVADLVSFNTVRSLRRLQDFAFSEGRTVAIHDRYWDTSGRALLAAGWALRSRERDGEILVTLKSLSAKTVAAPAGSAQEPESPIHARRELETRLERFAQPAEWPESPVRAAVLELSSGRTLTPLLEIDQRRFVRMITLGERAVAEASLDEVRLLSGPAGKEYCELEIELRPGGTPEDLGSILTALAREVTLNASPRSKFEEGLLLLDSAGADRKPGKRTRARAGASGLHRLSGAAIRLESPEGTTLDALAAELHRLGYRPSAGTHRVQTRVYYDTQGGSLYRADTELFFSPVDARWRLVQGRTQQIVQKGEPNAPPGSGHLRRQLKPIIQGRRCLPYVEATVRQTVFSVESISTPRMRLAALEWQLRSVLYDVPPRAALSVRIDPGLASSFDRDYLAGLLRDALGLREMRATDFTFVLGRLGAPLPGAPLPREFAPAPSDSVIEVCRKILGGEAWRMRANAPGAILDLDPEFVHDMRVATRRARFACRLFSAELGTALHDRIRTELSWLAQHLGAVRDLDVLNGRLAAQLALTEADAVASQAIAERLRERRVASQESLVSALRSPRYPALLEAMASIVPTEPPAGEGRPTDEEAPGGGRAAEPFARRRLEGALRKLGPWIQRSAEELTPVELHRLRILFKRLRYTAEFFRPVLGDGVSPLAKQCVVYQDVLGLHQDARVAIDVFTSLAQEETVRHSTPALLTLGALTQVQRDVMQAQRARFRRLWPTADELAELWIREEAPRADASREDAPRGDASRGAEPTPEPRSPGGQR